MRVHNIFFFSSLSLTLAHLRQLSVFLALTGLCMLLFDRHLFRHQPSRAYFLLDKSELLHILSPIRESERPALSMRIITSTSSSFLFESLLLFYFVQKSRVCARLGFDGSNMKAPIEASVGSRLVGLPCALARPAVEAPPVGLLLKNGDTRKSGKHKRCRQTGSLMVGQPRARAGRRERAVPVYRPCGLRVASCECEMVIRLSCYVWGGGELSK